MAKLIELDAHSIILETERELLGKTVLISIQDEASGDVQVQFFLTPFSESFGLHYEPPDSLEAARVLARQIGDTIGFTFDLCDVSDE